MATQAQIDANRANAQNSTGPRSVEGKETSRFNALKHGMDTQSLVIPGEDPAQFAALTQAYIDRFQPADAVEAHLVQLLARSDWHGTRFAQLEARYIELNVDPALPPAQAVAVLYSDPRHCANLRHIFRRQQAAERDWSRAHKELRRIQQERQEAPAPEPTAPVEIGFVPQLEVVPGAPPAIAGLGFLGAPTSEKTHTSPRISNSVFGFLGASAPRR